jgi:hypothetical protein
MRKWQVASWLAAGGGVWAAATAALSILAPRLFGSGSLIYWLSTVAICAGFVGLFLLLGRALRIATRDHPLAATLFSAPGLAGEVAVMLRPDLFLPSLRQDLVPAYAAFLFLGYSVLLASASVMGARVARSTPER